MVAEVHESFGPARALFSACGYVEEARLIDYVLKVDETPVEPAGAIVIPMTIDDLTANGLLEDRPPTCWQRSVETLTARKDETEGLAVVSDERIEAFILSSTDGEILALQSFIEDDGVRLKQLFYQLRARGMRTFRFPKVHATEIAGQLLETLGFRPAGGHVLYAARAQSA